MPSLRSKIKSALKDDALSQAVLSSTSLSVFKRDQSVAGLPDVESALKLARAVREKAVDNLEGYLEQFQRAFSSAGGSVHFASDASQACAMIIDILKRHNARQGVKSKSMVSEEIGLGEALIKAGVDAVESDLGEFIVQLAGEPPSHITAPALHRSRHSIGRLFAEKLHLPYSDDPGRLTKMARAVLRERFIKAQFGISGANFLTAESGHLVIVENEGNVRLGLSLPPLYIAVTGIEKVVEKLSDLPPLLQLLPRSATGQRISAYVHLLRPTRHGEDGPQEMHVVLVDNGRRRALRDEGLREMLLCIRCGACLNVCPVYRSVGGHTYGSVYPGPMGAVWSNIVGLQPLSKPELPFLSTLCIACRDVCPVKIDIPRMLLELRARAPKPLPEKIIASGWRWTMETPQRLEMIGRLARLVAVCLPGGWLEGKGGAFRDQIKG